MSEPIHPGFLIGVATAGYQSEGGYNGPGDPQNNWSNFESSGRVARTGEAAGFWTRYLDDFEHCRRIGLNAFRLSIEWARVQPTRNAERDVAPAFDYCALDAYAERLAACRNAGMEPIVTLHHFTHPAWLGADAWLRDETPALFEIFAKTALRHVNRRLTDDYGQPPLGWYVTINEPNMLVLNSFIGRNFPGAGTPGLSTGARAMNRLLAAHVRAYNAIHDLHEEESWPQPKVSLNTYCSDVYWSECVLLDLLTHRATGVGRHELRDYFHVRKRGLEAGVGRLPGGRRNIMTWVGRGIHALANRASSRMGTEETFQYFLRELECSPRARPLDYLGFDYYDPYFAHTFRWPKFSDLEHPLPTGPLALIGAAMTCKTWDWRVQPEGMGAFCRHYAKAFPGMGILIAENGMAQRSSAGSRHHHARPDRVLRSEFLSANLRQVRSLLDEGVPLLGYLHWSLTDNYEWGTFSPRFGLFQIDYQNGLTRHAVDRLGDNPSATYAQLIRELRLGG